MTIVAISGPESAGKTTLAKELESIGYIYRHWGPIAHDSVYLDALIEDSHPDKKCVWDRSWCCECVYGNLLPNSTDPARNSPRGMSRLRHDPWLGEWLYGRAVNKMALLGPNIEHLRNTRDETDLPCDPADEQDAYDNYGSAHGWKVIHNIHNDRHATQTIVNGIERDMRERQRLQNLFRPVQDPSIANAAPVEEGIPRWWLSGVGNPNGTVLIVADKPSSNGGSQSGRHLPLTSFMTTKLARSLGRLAFEPIWTNASALTQMSVANVIDLIAQVNVIICLGDNSQDFFSKLFAEKLFADRRKPVIGLIHPSALYRWGVYENQRKTTEEMFKHAVISGIDKSLTYRVVEAQRHYPWQQDDVFNPEYSPWFGEMPMMLKTS